MRASKWPSGNRCLMRRLGMPATLAATMMCWATTHARGQLPENVWRLSPRPVFIVGGVDAPPSELFSRIVGALRLGDGRFVVADGDELRLSLYGFDDELLATLGRPGDGPGEFRRIAGLWNPGGDTIAVWDSRAQRITHLLPDGTVIRTDRPRIGRAGGSVAGGVLDTFLGAMEDGRILLSWLVLTNPGSEKVLQDRMIFGLFDSNGQFQTLLGSEPGMFRTFSDRGSGPFVFSPFPWAAVVRDTLAYTNGDGRIAFFDPLAPEEGEVRAVTLKVEQVSLPDAWEALDAALAQADVPGPLMALAHATDRSLGTVPHHARMFADDRGRLWLKEYDPATDAIPLRGGRFVAGGRWLIYETDGNPVAYVRIPDDVAPLAVDGDNLLSIVRDELDVERFAVYTIIR